MVNSTTGGRGGQEPPCTVCDDFQTWKKAPPKKNSKSTQSNSSPQTSTTTISNECPPTKKELGNATWLFLHTTAAYYPKMPTNSEKESMLNLINSVSQLYPCKPCAIHMQNHIKKDKPKVDSNKEVGLWLCNFHNLVNKSLNKELFDCAKLEERYKSGPKDGRC